MFKKFKNIFTEYYKLGLVILFVFLFLVSIYKNNLSRETVLENPSKKIIKIVGNDYEGISNRYISVTPNPEYNIDDFLDMSLFKDFRPKINYNDIENKYNFYNNIFIDEERKITQYEFNYTETKIVITRQEISSGVDWSLSTKPYNKNYRDVLIKDIYEHFKFNDGKQRSVTIYNRKGDPSITIVLKGLLVEEIFYSWEW